MANRQEKSSLASYPTPRVTDSKFEALEESTMFRTHVWVLIGFWAWSFGASAQTRSQVYGNALTQQAQTVYARADVGMTTFESDAAGSKETQTSNAYTVGGWAGESRVVGVSFSSSDNTVPFSLNNSSLHAGFRDVRMVARFGWIMPSVGVSLNEVDVKRDGVETVGVYGTGLNAGLAVAVPLHARLVVQAEGFTSQNTKLYDKLNNGTKLGDRNEADAHLSFDVTERFIDLLVGYKLRQYEIQTSTENLTESSQGAYAGLRLGLYF
jgi:hypothetical protein